MTDWIKILREIADEQEEYAPYDNFDDSYDLRGAADYFEAKLRESALSELSALGQAQEAYAAQVEAENKLERSVQALEKYTCNCSEMQRCSFNERDLPDCGWTARCAISEIVGDEK